MVRRINKLKSHTIATIVVIAIAVASVLFLVYSYSFQDMSIDKGIDYCFNLDPEVTYTWRQCMIKQGDINSSIGIGRFAAYIGAIVLPAVFFGKTLLHKRLSSNTSNDSQLY